MSTFVGGMGGGGEVTRARAPVCAQLASLAASAHASAHASAWPVHRAVSLFAAVVSVSLFRATRTVAQRRLMKASKVRNNNALARL